MALKKNLRLKYNEIDISQLLKQWWHYKKLVFLGTIVISLISTFILIISDKTLSNQKQEYVMAILQGDLGKNNVRISSALRSREYLSETLLTVGLDLDPVEIINNLFIKFDTDPLKESLQNRIVSLEDKDIKNLSLSNEKLRSITKSLDDSSKDLISITFYHIPLNISYEQANNFLHSLIQNVNKKILLRTNREKLELNIINTKDLGIYFNEYERLSRLTNMISSVQSNLAVMRANYAELLLGVDLSEYINIANLSQKLLHELSNNLGNTIAIDSLKINILNKVRDIQDLKYGLEILETQNLLQNDFEDQQNNDDAITSSNNNTRIDVGVFDKILNLGSEISLINFKVETLSKIQSLQKERNFLINQNDLLDLPIKISNEKLTIDKVEQKIKLLSIKVNKAVMQVRSFTQPKAAIIILKNPELVVLNSKNISELIKFVCFLTLISFFIMSFISFLIPYKK
jgi:hypothetical protein